MEGQTVGFLGLGTMGAGMALRALQAGWAVTGWNRTLARTQSPQQQGVVIADDAIHLAESVDCIVLCVSDDAAVESVSLGENGWIHGVRSGALVIDCGTTSGQLTQRLERAARQRGAAFIDAPVTGSKLGAENGTLTFMVGGPLPMVERARPLLDVLGQHVVHVGDAVGLGQAAKLCLNLTQAVMLEGVLEGYVLAKRTGVPLDRMVEILEHSAGRSGVGAFKTPYLLRGDFTPHFRLDLMHKDLHLALADAAAGSIPLPAARSVLTLYDQAVAEGLGPRDFLALALLLERWGRVALRSDSPQEG